MVYRSSAMGRRLVCRWVCAFIASVISLGGLGRGQTHSGFPVDIIAGPAPHPLLADGRIHLLYELHITNFAPLPIELKAVDVFGDGATPLASYRAQELEKALISVEELSSAESPSRLAGTRTVGTGHAAMMFFDLTLAVGADLPNQLHHRFLFAVTRKNGETLERTVDGEAVAVVQEPTPLLQAPLRGSGWVAFNALGGADHRRSLNALDGKERIPQRFAIDWVRLGPDGRLFHGDTKVNTNYYGYGAEVLAVADGQVADLKDGLPENTGRSERSSRTITIDNAVGNYLTVDLGSGRFVLYAHLQPGSLKVRVGDKVSAGQVLALLGNSGNSDAPHLHFQLMDTNSPLGSEGIPYRLVSFTQLGVIDDEDGLDAGQPWKPKAQGTPVVHRQEFPIDKAVVTFP